MPLKVAIIGRPNVGKSTLFNRLAGKKLAIVHDKPGVTRDRKETQARLNDLPLVIIDTAGYEYSNEDNLEARMWEQTKKAIDEADVCLFLYDARAGLQPYDEHFADIFSSESLTFDCLRSPAVSTSLNFLPRHSQSEAMASRVTPASGPVSIRSSCKRALTSVDLPTFGRPTIAT